MTTRTINRSAGSLRMENNMPRFKRDLARSSAKAAAKGAHMVESELRRIFLTNDYGTWVDNEATTIDRKGFDKPMLDMGFLLDGLETHVKSIGSAENSAKVGWFNTSPHPRGGGLSTVELAMLHDGLGSDQDIASGPGGKSTIPRRPWISSLAYDEGKMQGILTEMELIVRSGVGGTIGPKPARGGGGSGVSVPEGFFDGGAL